MAPSSYLVRACVYSAMYASQIKDGPSNSIQFNFWKRIGHIDVEARAHVRTAVYAPVCMM